ncbi:MAG: hypothetical protein WC249_04265 [Patescibacteria group bacterium]|jgi:hypothetical protein
MFKKITIFLALGLIIFSSFSVARAVDIIGGTKTYNAAYNSSNVLLATPPGIQVPSPAAFLHFTGGASIAPYTMERTSYDWPAPYGIGWSTGGESAGIFQKFASNGYSLGKMTFYVNNDGAGSFAWVTGNWEGTTQNPNGSNNYNNEIMTLSSGGTLTATTFSGYLAGNALSATYLSANGANCGSGQFATGVDNYGAAEGCAVPATPNTWTSNLYINNTSPTIYFQDSDQRSAMIHNNSNVLYILTGAGVNSGTWGINGSYWPLEVNLNTDALTFGGPAYFMEGNVGVGTANPLVKLHIQAATYSVAPANTGTTATGNFRINDASNIAMDFGSINSPPYPAWVQVHDSSIQSVNYPLALQPNGGNVGIGTTAPGRKLEVKDGALMVYNAADNPFIYLKAGHASSYYPHISFLNSSDSVTQQIVGSPSGGNLLFDSTGGWVFRNAIDGGTTVVTIQNGGNVGIGTAAPGYKLQVTQSAADWAAHINGTGGYGLLATGSSYAGYFQGRIHGEGNLDVTGSVTAAQFVGGGAGITGVTATPSGPAGGVLSGTYPNPGFNNNSSYPVASGDGNGLKFWGGSDTYKIAMGNAADYHYGPVTDYSIKTTIDSVSSTRGFTWGVTGVTPIAALNVGNGNMQVAGSMQSINFYVPAASSGGLSDTGNQNWIWPRDTYGNFYVHVGTGGYYQDANVHYFRNASSANTVTIDNTGTVTAPAFVSGATTLSSRLYMNSGTNLHLDSNSTGTTYINYYGGTGGVNFCNGANGCAASVSAGGAIGATSMYDTNDGAYYMDLNGSSRFNYMGRNYGYNWTEYDWNDTAYYVDPNNTSKYNAVIANSFSVSGGSQFMASGQTQNMKLKGGSGTDVGLTAYNSADTWIWQLYGAGTTYGFLNSNWGGWDIMKTKGGDMVLNGSQTVITTANIGSQTVGNATNATNAPNYVLKAGDTMTGPLVINFVSGTGTNLTASGYNGATTGVTVATAGSAPGSGVVTVYNATTPTITLSGNTGNVSATSFSGSGSGLTGTASSLTAGYATTAGSINGYNNPTTAANANTIVYRDANADIYGRYIFGAYLNSASSATENPTIGAVWTQSTGDTYLRKSSPAWFISQLGLITTSNIGSQSVNYATTAGSAPANGGNAETVDAQNFTWNNTDNTPTYIWGSNTNGSSYLAYRTSMKVGSAYSADTATNQSGGTVSATGITDSGNLDFTTANPYINASSYFVAPGGAYFSSGKVYIQTRLEARGDIHNDAATSLTIAGGTSGLTTFTGAITAGTNKITAGTFDPVYTINNKHYATYLSGMTGVKEETADILTLKCVKGNCSQTIDFNNLSVASDLWLFSRVTNLSKNFSRMSILLSSGFNGSVWYEKNEAQKTLTIKALTTDKTVKNVEVSYRLTAPRFDSADWSNISTDETEGFNLDKLLKY